MQLGMAVMPCPRKVHSTKIKAYWKHDNAANARGQAEEIAAHKNTT